MSSFETLQELENFYDMLHPAQEKNKERFVWFSGIPHPLFNAIMHFSCDEQEAKEVFDTLIREAPPLPLSFWHHSLNRSAKMTDILKETGFQPAIVCPLMSWRTQSISLSSSDIRPATMNVFHDILGKAFHFDQAVKEGFASLMNKISAENYLIYRNDQPIGTGTLMSKGKVGGIFNLAILPDHQKNGYGRSLMQFLMKRSGDLGLEKLVLLSSPIAEKLYSSLGFTKELDIELYVR